MRSADIKNLSIAMEALSRIPGEDCVSLSLRIRDLLTDTIREQEIELHPPKPRPSIKDMDDEIPF